VLGARNAQYEYDNEHEQDSHRFLAMLMKPGQRGCAVYEDPAEYATGIDPDSDTDPDADGQRMPTNHFTCRLTAAGEFSRWRAMD
jgi:hypothetical protein